MYSHTINSTTFEENSNYDTCCEDAYMLIINGTYKHSLSKPSIDNLLRIINEKLRFKNKPEIEYLEGLTFESQFSDFDKAIYELLTLPEHVVSSISLYHDKIIFHSVDGQQCSIDMNISMFFEHLANISVDIESLVNWDFDSKYSCFGKAILEILSL